MFYASVLDNCGDSLKALNILSRFNIRKHDKPDSKKENKDKRQVKKCGTCKVTLTMKWLSSLYEIAQDTLQAHSKHRSLVDYLAQV